MPFVVGDNSNIVVTFVAVRVSTKGKIPLTYTIMTLMRTIDLIFWYSKRLQSALIFLNSQWQSRLSLAPPQSPMWTDKTMLNLMLTSWRLLPRLPQPDQSYNYIRFHQHPRASNIPFLHVPEQITHKPLTFSRAFSLSEHHVTESEPLAAPLYFPQVQGIGEWE